MSENKGKRKEGRAKGVTTQTMVSMRIDNENLTWANETAERDGTTRGRVINDAVAAAREAGGMKKCPSWADLRKKLLDALVLLDELTSRPRPMDGDEPPTLEEKADEEGFCNQ